MHSARKYSILLHFTQQITQVWTSLITKLIEIGLKIVKKLASKTPTVSK